MILATYLGYGVSLPPVVHVVVCVIGGFVGGAVLGWLVGELKARTGAHEVIITIMLNYIMAYLLAYLLSFHYLMQAPGTTNPISPAIAGERAPAAPVRLAPADQRGLPGRAGLRVRRVVAAEPDHDGLRVPQRRQEPQRRAGGGHERGADLGAGHADRRRAGRAGGPTVIQGTDFTLNFQSYGTYGIDAITVALLGLGRPRRRGARPALLFGALHAGAPLMQAATGTPVDMVQVLRGGDRPVRRGAAADPGHIPAARGPGRRRRRGACPRGGTHDDHRTTSPP